MKATIYSASTSPTSSPLTGRRLKTLKGLTPYEFICKAWASQPERFTLDPLHQMPGLNLRSNPYRAACGGPSRDHQADLGPKPISPHIFRHSLAMKLLQSGVDLLTIHAQVATTHRYAAADVEMMRKGLEKAESPAILASVSDQMTPCCNC